MPGRRLETDQELRDLLAQVRTVVVVGLSPKPDRPSHRVGSYLQQAGYRIVPVHPAADTVLGETAYRTLTDAVRETAPEVVDVFLRPQLLGPLVEEARDAGVRCLWFQLGVTDPAAEAKALEGDIDLVVNRCLMVEHRRLMGGE